MVEVHRTARIRSKAAVVEVRFGDNEERYREVYKPTDSFPCPSS